MQLQLQSFGAKASSLPKQSGQRTICLPKTPHSSRCCWPASGPLDTCGKSRLISCRSKGAKEARQDVEEADIKFQDKLTGFLFTFGLCGSGLLVFGSDCEREGG